MTDYLFRSRLLRLAAAPLSAAYLAALKLRPAPEVTRLAAKVISIGNIHVGGTGKTPLVLALARRLKALGAEPAIVSRGYRGRLSAVGAEVTADSSADDTGDEPLELARALEAVPVFIGRDRVEAARKAMLKGRVLILDDGFQHRRLHRDLDVVVIPGSSRPRDQRMLPLGRLREPLPALQRADAVVLVREVGEEESDPTAWKEWTDAPIFTAERIIDRVRPRRGTVDPVALLGRKVVVFSGVANPSRFLRVVKSAGARIVEDIAFADHHVYTDQDLNLLNILVMTHDAVAVTTEKDDARLGHRPLPFPTAVLSTSLTCDAFLDFCERRIPR